MKNVFLMMFLFSLVLYAQDVLPEHGTISRTGYVEYLPGNIPLIISIPHDGEKNPMILPDRNGKDVTKSDAGTQEMGWAIRESFFKKTGKIPYLVINHLRRRKVDVNREVEEASGGNKTAEMVWDEYHSFIDEAKEAVLKDYRRGLYIDLHAHNHTAQFLELGYLLDAEELQLGDTDLEDDLFIDKSSLRNLVKIHPKKAKFISLLRGDFSLGTLLEKSGYPAIPSRSHPAPELEQPFFRGGYSLNRHCVLTGGAIDGIQIETNFKNVRDNSENINKFSEVLTDILLKYLDYHFDIQISSRISQK